MRFNTPIVADEFDADEQAMVGGPQLVLADLVAEDYWLDRIPLKQAFIDLEVSHIFLTLAAIAVISASMTDIISA